MRIGILTLSLHTNYGGILQAYALQTVLERMGHEVVVFQNDYDGLQHIPSWKLPLFILKRILRKCFVDRNALIFIEKKVKREQPIIRQNTSRFLKDYIHSFHVNSLCDIPIEEFDAIVVGSDQIWRAEYFRRIWGTGVQNAYLGFAQSANLYRIAYAVSFGKDSLDYSEKELVECAQLVQLFNAVSVREESGLLLCSKYLGVKANHVLDPTMLINSLNYIELIKRSKVPRSAGNLFAYILDDTPEKVDFISLIAKQNNMVPYSIKMSDGDLLKPVEQRIVPPVEEWLRGFYDAELVITDSFHGCVFSIIFGKPFIALGNAMRGSSRFVSLLKMFSLEKHLIFDINDDISLKIFEIPNDLNRRLSVLQEESFHFLNQALQ